MKLKMIVGFVIFYLLFVVSCNSQYIAGPSPIPTITPAVANSPKPTATIEPIITNCPQPAAAINSTAAPSPTLSPARETDAAVNAWAANVMLTLNYYMDTEVPATLEARDVKCKDGFVLEQDMEILQISNDLWTIFTCSPLPKNGGNRWTPGVVDYGERYTQITKTDLSQTWIIQHNTFDYSIIDRPDALMIPYRWTADGKFLYLYPSYYPGGSGFPQTAYLQTNISSLYRIDLETGDFELVLRSNQFGALALSPDEQFLAYSEQEKPDIIHIKNMEGSNDLQVKLYEDIIASGAFVWNSEGTKVVITIGYDRKSKNWQEDLSATAIYVLTPKYMHAQKILAKDSRIFIPYECSKNSYWLDENTLCIHPINEELDSWNKIFTINIETGKVVYLRPYP